MKSSDVLRAAAIRLRDVAPDIDGPLQGLADPVAELLDHQAEAYDRLHTLVDGMPENLDHPAFRVARTILGIEQ